MPWYSIGTVAVTNNSATVTGSGTSFSANARVGDAFRGPDGLWYEVTNVASATVISIKPNYQGANSSAGSYAIAPMQGYVKDSADALRGFVNQYGTLLASLGPLAVWQPGQTAVLDGGLSITGSGRRITGDMSNAAVASRLLFQTSTVNGATSISGVPNGTSSIAVISVFSAAAAANCSFAALYTDGIGSYVSSDRLGTGAYLPLIFTAGGTERSRITATGEILVGTSSTAGFFGGSADNYGTYTSGAGGIIATTASPGNANYWANKRELSNPSAFAFGYRGGVVGTISITSNTTSYNTSSDYRLKTDVKPLNVDEAISRIMAYEPCTWTWLSDGSYGKGFIAHKNQAIDPETASGKKDEVRRLGDVRLQDHTLIAADIAEPEDMSAYGDGAKWHFTHEVPAYQGRDDTKMIPDMVAMMQRHQGRIAELEAQLQQVLAQLQPA